MSNPESEEFIQNHINYIRRMALLNDDIIRLLLRQKVAEDPSIIEKFKENKMKKEFSLIEQMAKDIKTEPMKLARKVA